MRLFMLPTCSLVAMKLKLLNLQPRKVFVDEDGDGFVDDDCDDNDASIFPNAEKLWMVLTTIATVKRMKMSK